MIYLYARVSTDKQENGRVAQVARLNDWCVSKDLAVDTEYVDEDVSAYSVQLRDRPQGKAMWDRLSAGDSVVVTRVDRAFRSLADCAVTIDLWRKLGITLHILDMPIDLATPQGRLFLSLIGSFAEFESAMHGQRKREVYANKRQSGQPYNQLRPFGWLSVKDAAGKLAGWKANAEEQEIGKRAVKMHSDGESYYEIATAFALEGVRKPHRRKDSSGYYHVNDVLCLCRAAAAGYPKLPRAFWQERGYEQRLAAMKCHAPQLSS
jgi:DNA invertase Pin-like site-specific DNA recombinase